MYTSLILYDITGGVAQSITCYILPGIIGYLAFPENEPDPEEEPKASDDDRSSKGE